METEAKEEITGKFNWKAPSVVPSFVSGEDARAIYEQVKGKFGNVWYDEESKTMYGSNFPIAARVDSIVRHLGIRVASLADLSKQEIMEMMKGKHYSDTPALVLRSEQDSYEPNNDIIRELLPHVEEKQGKLELPVLVRGLDVVVSAKNKYGWGVVPRDDFNVIEDERLDVKYNGNKFLDTDGIGLPIFDKKGSRTWYAGAGISGLYLGRNLGLNSCYGYLADSGESGRVALILGEAAPKFFDRYTSEIEMEFKKQESELLERKGRALRILKGKE